MATGVTDLVLVHIDGKPAFFARIEDITPDVKPGWWHVRLLVLTLPLQVYTWILQETQIDGEPFTMGGTPVVIEKVVPPEASGEEAPAPPQRRKEEEGKVVSIFSRKKEEDK